eukprot:13199800-Heterocapsa_arctica.AAC.1
MTFLAMRPSKHCCCRGEADAHRFINFVGHAGCCRIGEHYYCAWLDAPRIARAKMMVLRRTEAAAHRTLAIIHFT